MGKAWGYNSIIPILQKKSDESLRRKLDSSLVLRQYDNTSIRQKINTTDESKFIDDFRIEYGPAEILAQLRLKKSEFTWHIHSYVYRRYCYGEERIMLELVRVKHINDDGTFTMRTVLPSNGCSFFAQQDWNFRLAYVSSFL